MADVDQDRRDYLIAKYGIDQPPMDPQLNMTVQTVLAAEHLEARAFPRGTEYNQWLFDPARAPEMHEIATRVHRKMREIMARDELGEPNDSRMLVHFVGSEDVHPVYPGWTANRFAEDLRKHNATQPYCDVAECNIRVADECGPSTVLMPLLFGGVLLIFECCANCHAKACRMAGDGYRLSLMEAQERAAAAPQSPWALPPVGPLRPFDGEAP